MKECNQCGKCCIQYGDGRLSATEEEIQQWEIFSPSIAEFVADGKIWMDPVSGEQLTSCPWLEILPATSGPDSTSDSASNSIRYGCRIYHHRPEECRHYPVSIAEMVRDGCEMIELHDLDDSRQAQIDLDLIMADSRPPLA